MRNQTPSNKPKPHSRYGSQRQISNMATPRRPEPPSGMGILGFFFLLGIFGGLVWLVMLIFGLGPYNVAVAEVTPTATEIQTLSLAASSTVSPIAISTQTPTLTPTQTLTATITTTPTLELLPFVLDGEPEATRIELVRPQLNCDWLVIAGQVWDLQGDPVVGSTLHLFGEIAGYSIDQTRLSGSALAYGRSGYEFTLEGLVVDSEDSLFIQLFDTNDQPLSHPYPIQTYEDCQRNLILVNFKQVR